MHYSHDAWENLPPKDAIAILRKAGLKRAVVSSSGDDGTQRLRRRGARARSCRRCARTARAATSARGCATTTVDRRFSRSACASSRYAAIGEFHLYGADADLPVPRRMVALAKQYKLILHAHSDVDAIERLFRQDPDARILWAHSGFERPDSVRDVLRKHKNLWCDLAFRSEHGSGGKVPAEWRALFTEFPDRFMVGTDTFTPERWHYIVEHANWSRAWLADLPAAAGRAHRVAQRRGAVRVLEAAAAAMSARTAAASPSRVALHAPARRTHAATRCRRRARPSRTAHYVVAYATAPEPDRRRPALRRRLRRVPAQRAARRRSRCASTPTCRSTGTA